MPSAQSKVLQIHAAIGSGRQSCAKTSASTPAYEPILIAHTWSHNHTHTELKKRKSQGVTTTLKKKKKVCIPVIGFYFPLPTMTE
jgi:hypothetical protein